MRHLPWLLALLLSTPALAQEEPAGDEGGEAESILHPPSGSPEAAHPRRHDVPRLRVQAFLIPIDEGARTPTTRVAQALQGVLTRTPAYEVVDLGRALAVQSTAEQAQHADAGRNLLEEANQAAVARGWPEAAAGYQRAVEELEEGLPAVAPREYAEAVLRLGTAKLISGEDAPARELFALAVRLDPQRRLSAEGAIAAQLEQARAELAGATPGALDVDVRPAGARIFVDGELRGQHVEAPAGRHLLRVERAGFYPYAELVELAPRKPVKISVTLAATPTATSLNQLIAGGTAEVSHGLAGRNLEALARQFSLGRVLIGSLRSVEETRVSLLLALVDAEKRQVIGSRVLTLVADGTDADRLEEQTQDAARRLIAADDALAPPLAAAAPPPSRQPVIPGAVPAAARGAAADPGPVAHERKVIMPADAAAPASKEAVKKARARSLREKTGTEEWGDD